MSLYTLGLNHTTAPIEVRERVAFSPDALTDALRDLIGAQGVTRGVKEAAILSTCNRTEVYFHGSEPESVAQWLAGFHNLAPAQIEPYVYTLPRDKAVAHAFRVASGLDSMVLGEPQILGQMKQAVRSAESAGSLGLVLNRLFQRTFAVAKDVRTQTDIGSASISMAAAAVKLAERIFPSIADAAPAADRRRRDDRTGGDALRRAKQPKSVTVANRTLERGSMLADRFGADAITLNELPERLHEFDIIVTCTASTLPILGKGLLERVVKQRRHAPVFIVDLAVPRDVEPEAGELDDVFLYTVDDLVGHRAGQPADPARVGGAGRADDRRPDRAFPALDAGAHAGADDQRAVRPPRRAARSGTRARATDARRRHGARPGAGAAGARAHQQAAARAAVGAQCRRRRRARGNDRACSSASTGWIRPAPTSISCATCAARRRPPAATPSICRRHGLPARSIARPPSPANSLPQP